MSRRVIRQQAIFSLGTALLCLAPLLHAHAAGPAMQWPLCHTMTTFEQGGAKEDSRTSPTEITADYGEGIGNRLYTVRGDDFMRRGDQELEADQAVYDHKTGYQYAQRHAHGEAATLMRESADITQLYRATYTTCDPGKVDWQLRARHVTLDQSKAVGVARDVTVRFKGVPLLYLPYINFPLNDERKTGVLPPTIGYSNQTGLDLAVPFYWNIAPDRDATITPHNKKNHNQQTRDKNQNKNPSNSGRIEAEYLPNDALFGRY